ncbi:MAG: apolipoprotein N-acyltransferase [Phycisphaerae bacterium]|nr:apolipoprotein N-acyltransferase [Phycisphaerae bacterium]
MPFVAAPLVPSPNVPQLADQRLHPWLLVFVYTAGTVLGYGFDLGVVPAALGLAAGLRLAMHPLRMFRHNLGLFVALSIGWSLAERWLGAYSTLAQLGMGVYTAFWPTLLVLLTGRRPGALCRFVIFGAALDALRGTWVFGGYGFDPWSRLLLANEGLAQWLSVFGPWVGSALVLAFFALPWRWSVGGVLSCMLLGSMLRPHPVESGLELRLVQTNLPQDLRAGWATERWIPDVTEFLTASASGPSVDLVVWPETMLPGFGFESESDVLDQLRRPWAEPAGMVKAWAKEFETPMLVGTNIRDGLVIDETGLNWDRQVNASVLVHPDGTTERAEKIGLTPFGEFIPLVSTVPELRELLLKFAPEGSPIGAGLARGETPGRFELGGIRLATPICYESTLPGLMRSFAFDHGERLADLFIVSSNDGWFGGVDAARARFRDMCRMRAIENRTPVARVANTGWTGLIDASGRMHTWLPVRRSGHITVKALVGEGVPWAVRGALIWDWGLVVAVIGVGVWSLRHRRHAAG